MFLREIELDLDGDCKVVQLDQQYEGLCYTSDYTYFLLVEQSQVILVLWSGMLP